MGRKNEKVSFWRGKHSNIPSNIVSGRLLYEQDTGDVFFDYRDYSSGELKRIQITDSTKMPKSGGKFTGDVILYKDPENELGAVTKRYADNIKKLIDDHIDNEEIHVTQSDKNNWNNKVDKEEGKGLSECDFTIDNKEKLENLVDNATYTSFDPYYDDTTGYDCIGTIIINDDYYDIWYPKITDIEGNAETASRLLNTVYIDGIEFDGQSSIYHYALCSTAGGTEIKTANINRYTLNQGSIVYINFRYNNTIDNPKLNISNTGSYPIYYMGEPITKDYIKTGTYQFVFLTYSGISRYEMVVNSSLQYGLADETHTGLISASDYEKLLSIEEYANNYVLPPATNLTLGGVIVGQNIYVDSDGRLYIDSSTIEDALGYSPLGRDDLTPEYISETLEPFIGATENSPGAVGLVPRPGSGEQNSVLFGDGYWHDMTTIEVESIPSSTIDSIVNESLKKNFFLITESTGTDSYNLYYYYRDELDVPSVGDTFDGHVVHEVTIGEIGEIHPQTTPIENIKSVKLVDEYTPETTSLYNAFYVESTELLDDYWGVNSSKYSNCDIIDLEKLDTSNITNMEGVFYGCKNVETLNISSWNTQNVTNMSHMFFGCKYLYHIDTESWNTINVKDMSYMLCMCYQQNSSIAKTLNTSNVTNMEGMYQQSKDTSTHLDLTNFDTSKVTNMSGMFTYNINSGTAFSSIDLTSFNTSKVTNMENMFSNCRYATRIYASSNFIVTQVTNSSNMFLGCNALVGVNGDIRCTYSTNSPTDKSMARIPTSSNTSGYFSSK